MLGCCRCAATGTGVGVEFAVRVMLMSGGCRDRVVWPRVCHLASWHGVSTYTKDGHALHRIVDGRKGHELVREED